MQYRKTKYAVAKVTTKEGKLVGYLSSRDEEKEKDIEMDMKGYVVTSL